jgi:hypothetical protein
MHGDLFYGNQSTATAVGEREGEVAYRHVFLSDRHYITVRGRDEVVYRRIREKEKGEVKEEVEKRLRKRTRKE